MKKILILSIIAAWGCSGPEKPNSVDSPTPPPKIDTCAGIFGGLINEDSSRTYFTETANGFLLSKQISKTGQSTYTVSLEGESADEIKGYGVNIQLSDGESINRDDQLVTSGRNRVKGNYRNYTIFDITEDEVRKISKGGVHGFIINVNYVKIDSSDLIKNMALCLLDKK